MTTLKISIPIYKRKTWGDFSEQGMLEVATSSESDTLSESYEKLKPQIAELLAQVQSETQIVVELRRVQTELQIKKEAVRDLSLKIERANKQLERLTRFLASFGIKASDINLNITTAAIAEFRPVELIVDDFDDDSEEAEVDPIPFDSADSDNNPHEF